MFKKKIITIMLVILTNQFPLIAENKTKAPDFKKISDNLKFENALLFYNLGNSDRALEEFNEYLEIFIHGIHKKKVYQNIAKIYFDRFDFLKAIEIYSSLYGEFSSSEEGIDAYYMMGVCYRKMGYNNSASNIFKSIVKEYPDSKYARLSRIQTDILGIINENI